jgi:hypothetical protein
MNRDDVLEALRFAGKCRDALAEQGELAVVARALGKRGAGCCYRREQRDQRERPKSPVASIHRGELP